ncbi:MAG TPA: 50S ribosomal protein L11 methyltransferase [Solirubrobacteraceae bacterium]|nr:50S ribosomal protein L11 methyltransferase [Solirubrobacteraceae bacterium]
MIRLAVRVERAQAELVLAELLELTPAGVEEVALADGIVEYAVYGAAGEIPSLPDLRAAAGDALVEISTSETADDWQERWKQFHRPVSIAAPSARGEASRQVPGLCVRPPWESELPLGSGPVEQIVIDPGQAFGTGAHATTRLCLELLLELAADDRAQRPLLDVGTGSGVLAIAAARLGFAPVLALDHERESVEAARENAIVNDAEIEVRRFDLRSESLPWPGGASTSPGKTVVMANLLLPLLLELSRTIGHAPEHLIASGLLRGQVDEVVDAFSARLGLRERARRESGDWAAAWLVAEG